MPATPLQPSRLAEDLPAQHVPRLPVVVVASNSGGTGKTALAVPIAERLAWAGLRVLMMTCSPQEDARYRLGVTFSEGPIARRDYGAGLVVLVGLRPAKAIDILYGSGPEPLGMGSFDIAVLDTPAAVQSGSLPGVLLVAPMDGADAARNLVTMLSRTPGNSSIVLVRLEREAPDDWTQNVAVLEEVLQRSLDYYPDPLVKSKPVKEAHDAGRSVWTLPRTGRNTLAFLSAVETLAKIAWGRVYPDRPWPAPPPGAGGPYVPGWEDDDELGC